MLEDLSRAVFGVVCHQHEHLLLEVEGRLLLLCPRCAGLQLGFLTAFAVTRIRFGRDVRIAGTGALVVLAAAVGSLLIDWGVGGQIGLFTPSHESRLVTGLLCGAALGMLLLSYRRGLAPRPAAGLTDLTLGRALTAMALSVAAGVLSLSVQSWAFVTVLCLSAVAANAAVVMDTTIRMFTARARHRRGVGAVPQSIGGDA